MMVKGIREGGRQRATIWAMCGRGGVGGGQQRSYLDTRRCFYQGNTGMASLERHLLAIYLQSLLLPLTCVLSTLNRRGDAIYRSSERRNSSSRKYCYCCR